MGFVERKQNKDFNIVYRNKPAKPLTVSELFGLNKETKKDEEDKKVVEQPKQVEEKAKKSETKVDNNLEKEEKREITEEKNVEVKEEKQTEKMSNEDDRCFWSWNIEKRVE